MVEAFYDHKAADAWYKEFRATKDKDNHWAYLGGVIAVHMDFNEEQPGQLYWNEAWKGWRSSRNGCSTYMPSLKDVYGFLKGKK